METRREDVGIVIRSAFLAKGTKQRFSLFVLIILSIILLFIETIETKPLNYLRSFVKDTIYRGSLVVSIPFKSFNNITEYVNEHVNLYNNYIELKIENKSVIVIDDVVTSGNTLYFAKHFFKFIKNM